MKAHVKYIIRDQALGDVLWVEPVIKSVAKLYNKVIVVSGYNELFDNYPLPNVFFKKKLSLLERFFFFIESKLKTQFFFINLNKAYEQNPNTHLLLAYYQKAKRSGPLTYPSLYLNKDESKINITYAAKYVVLHIENYPAGFNFRNAYGINWEEVSDYLINKGYQLIQIGKEENKIKNALFVKTSIRELISLLNNASFIIGMDSGPSHIAQCLNKPSLIFFGSVNPWFRHVKHQFNGFISQQPCEYANCFHEQTPGKQTCLLIGDSGNPKCCTYSTGHVIKYIDQLAK